LYLFNFNEFCRRLVVFIPFKRFFQSFVDGLLLLIRYFANRRVLLFQILQDILDTFHVVLKSTQSIESLLSNSILLFIIFSILDHLLDLLFSESTFTITDDNLLRVSSTKILSTYTQNTISINFEGSFQLRFSTKGRRNSLQSERV